MIAAWLKIPYPLLPNDPGSQCIAIPQNRIYVAKFLEQEHFCTTLYDKHCKSMYPVSHRFFEFCLGSSTGLCAATAASYCPSRAGELPKNNPKTLSA